MGCSASKKESTLVHEATEEIREGPFRTKFDAMIDARDAITADLKNDAAVDALIETYEKAIGGIKATLATEPAPASPKLQPSKRNLRIEGSAMFGAANVLANGAPMSEFECR